MPAKKGSRINLLPQEEFEASTFGRVLTWALSSFRIIVIVTEMVVMLAFLSRFWLDARMTDLNELIKARQAAIVAQALFEKQFRLLQTRLKIFDALSQEPSTSGMLSLIASYLPSDVFLSNLSKNGDSIQVRGLSASERSIAQFVANLEASSTFAEVTLSDVEESSEDKTLLAFTLKLTPRTKGGKT